MKGGDIGECYAWHGNMTYGIEELSEMWIAEIYDNPGRISSIEKYNGMDGVGHFTQVTLCKENSIWFYIFSDFIDGLGKYNKSWLRIKRVQYWDVYHLSLWNDVC